VAELVNGLLRNLMSTSGDSPRMQCGTALADASSCLTPVIIDVSMQLLLPAEPEQRDGAAILLFIFSGNVRNVLCILTNKNTK
jgi:hypothetical protein